MEEQNEELGNPVLNEDEEAARREANRAQRKKGIIKEVLEWVGVVAAAVLIALFVNHFIIANAYVPSGSMEETIMTDDKVIGLRTAYWFSKPERGDIAIFYYPDDEKQIFIKRIIGLPGETVRIVDGLVFINDSEEALVEPYVKGTPTGTFGPYEVPEGCYFMLGDNRAISKDSRYWQNTFVKEEKILAKAVFRYYPSFKKLD